MMPDVKPDRSEIASFDASKLKHVETTDKSVLPTKDGMFYRVHIYNYIYYILLIIKNWIIG